MKRESVITLLVLLVILVLVASAAWYFQSREQEAEEIVENKALAIFEGEETADVFTTINGHALDLSEDRGKVFIVQSWASWCPPCAGQLRVLSEIQREHPEVKVMAVNRSENERAARKYLSKQTGIDNLTLVFDANDRFFDQVGAYNMPETVVFDTQGVIVFQEHGPTTKHQINAVLRSLQE